MLKSTDDPLRVPKRRVLVADDSGDPKQQHDPSSANVPLLVVPVATRKASRVGNASNSTLTTSTSSSSTAAENQINDALYNAVLDSNLGDLEEICHDVESLTVYSLRAENLTHWSSQLRMILRSFRETFFKQRHLAVNPRSSIGGGPATYGSSASSAANHPPIHATAAPTTGQQPPPQLQFQPQQPPASPATKRKTLAGNANATAFNAANSMMANPDSSGREATFGVAKEKEGPSTAREMGHLGFSGSLLDTRLTAGHAGPPQATATSIAASIYLLMEAAAASIGAEWGTCFVYQAKTEQLVSCCGVGKRACRAGTVRLGANVGIEGHVFNSGVAINVAHPYMEDEFSGEQDRLHNTRTKNELVFPLLKPGSGTQTFGIIQFANRFSGGTFTPEEEARVAECARFLSLIIARYPSDVTNGNCFDPTTLQRCAADVGLELRPQLFPPIPGGGFSGSSSANAGPGGSPGSGALGSTGAANSGHPRPPPIRDAVLIFRTARAGHLRRTEVLRDASAIDHIPTITEAIGHVAKVSEAWRNAVALNMELEREIKRLHEALRVSRREVARFQGIIVDLRKTAAQTT